MLPYVISGLVIGAVYAIAASGLVLTYATTRILNLAHGAIAFFVAVAYHHFRQKWEWPIPMSAIASIGVIAPFIGLVLWATVFRRIGNAPVVVKIVATVGLFVALPALALMIFRPGVVYAAPGVAPRPLRVWRLGDAALNADQLAVLVGALAIAVIIWFVMQHTSLGLVTRAVVDSPTVAGLIGIRANAVAAGVWMVGSVLAGLAGVLLAPLLNLSNAVFTELTVAALAIAVAAKLRSTSVAYLVAMALGIGQSLIVKYAEPGGLIATGVRPALPVILLIVLLLLGRIEDLEHGDPVSVVSEETSGVRPETRSGWSGPLRLAAPLVVVLLAAVTATVLTAYWIAVVALGLAFAVIFLSFVAVVGEGGIISLGQASFAGIGGFAAARMLESWEASWLLAAVGASLLGAVVAAGVGWPALRLGELPLGLLTLGFALFCDTVVFKEAGGWLNPGPGGVAYSRPTVLGLHLETDTDFLYLLSAVFAAIALGISLFRRTGSGLLMSALRGNRRAAAGVGISPMFLRLGAFAAGGAIAALGGVLLASYQYQMSNRDVGAVTSLVWLAVAVTWGARSVPGALLGGVSLAVIPALLIDLPPEFADLPALVFGLGAVALAQEPRGMLAMNATMVARLRSRRQTKPPGRTGLTGSAAGHEASAARIEHIESKP